MEEMKAEMRAEMKAAYDGMVKEAQDKYNEVVARVRGDYELKAKEYEKKMAEMELAMEQQRIKYEGMYDDQKRRYDEYVQLQAGKVDGGDKGRGKGGGEDKWRSRRNVVDCKAYGNLGRNVGKNDEFLDWKFNFKIFLDSEDKNFKGVLKEIENLKVDDIDDFLGGKVY